MIARLREALDKAGLKGSDYCGISLRRGGAQTLLRMKANDRIIMGLGRWSSSCFNRYLAVTEVEVQKWQKAMATTGDGDGAFRPLSNKVAAVKRRREEEKKKKISSGERCK